MVSTAGTEFADPPSTCRPRSTVFGRFCRWNRTQHDLSAPMLAAEFCRRNGVVLGGTTSAVTGVGPIYMKLGDRLRGSVKGICKAANLLARAVLEMGGRVLLEHGKRQHSVSCGYQALAMALDNHDAGWPGMTKVNSAERARDLAFFGEVNKAAGLEHPKKVCWLGNDAITQALSALHYERMESELRRAKRGISAVDKNKLRTNISWFVCTSIDHALVTITRMVMNARVDPETERSIHMIVNDQHCMSAGHHWFCAFFQVGRLGAVPSTPLGTPEVPESMRHIMAFVQASDL